VTKKAKYILCIVAYEIGVNTGTGTSQNHGGIAHTPEINE